MNIGQRIKERRKELKMSAEELAKKLGKDRSTIYRYEKGDIENLPLDILAPIADALDTFPAYLMGWMEEVEEKPVEVANELSEIFLDKELREMIADYKLLDEEKKKQAREFIRFLGGRN